MKCKITWIEYHMYCSDTWKSFKDMEEDYGGIITGEDDEGSLEFEIFRYFEANTIEEAKKKAIEIYEGDSGVFIVDDENGNRLFDEQDCEEVA